MGPGPLQPIRGETRGGMYFGVEKKEKRKILSGKGKGERKRFCSTSPRREEETAARAGGKEKHQTEEKEGSEDFRAEKEKREPLFPGEGKDSGERILMTAGERKKRGGPGHSKGIGRMSEQTITRL